MYGGLFEIIKELKVNNIIVGKQFEKTKNFERLLEIVKEKNIKINYIERGVKINIEKNIYFDIYWPDSKQIIQKNNINNNALVCKLNYKQFSVLFTGDIEEEAEEKIINLYKKNPQILKSTVLKVAHHGSDSSSTIEFLKMVSPKIALIGVGKNNKYGHPSLEVISKIKEQGINIYRTDENGEITLKTNGIDRIEVREKLDYYKIEQKCN